MTEGILKNPVAVNNTYVLVQRSKEMNLDTYRQHANVTKRNIEILEATLTRALRARNEKDYAAVLKAVFIGENIKRGNI